jgi:mono/diheme cytochrome c family protein
LKDDVEFYTGRLRTWQPGGASGQQQSPPGETTAVTQTSQPTAQTFQGFVTEFPMPISAEDLDHGQERFNIYCAVCHGRLGDGAGMIVRRGFRRPPSFHDDRLRNAPVGYFFDVETNGFGAMPDYAAQIPPDDRWRIIAYIRALQLSQGMKVAELPPGEREKVVSASQRAGEVKRGESQR